MKPASLIKASAAVLLLPLSCLRTEYHPYDGRISGERDINARSVSRIEEECRGKDTVRFAVISDTQRHYDETDEAVKAVNAMKGVDFVIHLGDITDFGETREFLNMRDRLLRLSIPAVALIGNHDCLGTGGKVYSAVFGPTDFAFTAGKVRFVCLNTNSREYGTDADVPDFSFIAAERAEADTVLSTVVCMHAPPGSEQFDANVAPLFESSLLGMPHLLFCLNGHTHHWEKKDIFGDGNIYYTCPSIENHTLLLFRVWSEGYDYDTVAF